MYMSINVYVVA